MEILFFGISLALIIGSFIIIVRELLVRYYNPLPKFENGDKRIDDIRLFKTRKIEGFSQRENKND